MAVLAGPVADPPVGLLRKCPPVLRCRLAASLLGPVLLLLLVLFPASSRLALWPAVFPWRPRSCACRCLQPAPRGDDYSSGAPGPSDVAWLRQQVQQRGLRVAVAAAADGRGGWMAPRKGINPRSRQQQLFDIRRFHGISHYENRSGTSEQVGCPDDLLVEPHHSYYGEPWAGGRDVFEFLAAATSLRPHHRVLEVGCGTLRAGLHFIRFLHPSSFVCWDRDPLSLAAALLYELPANGLLPKRPSLLLADDVESAHAVLDGPPFDLVYASAAFLHMPGAVVWKSVSMLGKRLRAPDGRLFVSHNIKFCTRLSWKGCQARLREAGLDYVGRQTHDSLLFNHFEIWHEFKAHGK